MYKMAMQGIYRATPALYSDIQLTPHIRLSNRVSLVSSVKGRHRSNNCQYKVCQMATQGVYGATPALYSDIQLTPDIHLSNRVVMAPLTRCRAIDHVPRDCHVVYYSQRASEGGLVITEATGVSDTSYGFPHTAGIHTDEQVEAWRKVTDAVHAKGAVIFCQIWNVGRASHVVYQPDGQSPVSSTDKPVPDDSHIILPNGARSTYSAPRALSESEIPDVVGDYRRAAANAISAGFDGVEIHGAHGYLVDQFLKDGINDRTDSYGGSLENRCRFALQVLSAITEEIGPERTALRISPVIDHLGACDSDPLALVSYLISRLNEVLTEPLAYLHVTEPRFTSAGTKDVSSDDEKRVVTEMWRIVKGFKRGWVMRSGGFVKESAEKAVDTGDADLVSFGRLFISNPDLPRRLAQGLPLNAYNRDTFYISDPVKGYTDYPFYEDNGLPSDSAQSVSP